jgi:DNA repair photolyase
MGTLTIRQLQRGLADQDGTTDDFLPATLPLTIERVRTFATPEFSGMRFLEVEAKSALNRVRGMPFPWSINPYRGCSHACNYCCSGNTPILMADGRTKPLAEVRVGDAIYGTVRRGASRRYVITQVLDHWSTTKPAYRIALEDGTELITSGDHRFLTNGGWKHVTDSEQGLLRRPSLTWNDELMGTGEFAAPPKDTADYRLGYLCGIQRDNLVGVGVEALQRMRRYQRDLRIPIKQPAFQDAACPSDDWRKGFLAGVFDAEGSCTGGILRILTRDGAVIEQIASCLRRFAFPFATEIPQNGCLAVRLRAGLREQLRFFHTVDPAITSKRTIEGRALKNDVPLRVVKIEPLQRDLPLFDITTGTGDFIANGVVSHNCFARPSHSYLNLSPLGDFERTIVVKTNLVEVLRRELARPSWTGEHVAMGTNTDPYQRCEGRYRLMPGVIDALAEGLTPFSILTKGTLIIRDLEPLRAAAERVYVSCALTIGMLDRELWRQVEPGAPSPQARLDAVTTLRRAGISVGVMLAPIMPGLNDDPDTLDALVDAAAAAGAAHITPIVLHLRPGVRELFWPWLAQAHPELVDRYRQLYRGANAAAEYRKRVEGFVAERRRAAWARHGRPDGHPSVRSRPRRPACNGPAAEVHQLRLL